MRPAVCCLIALLLPSLCSADDVSSLIEIVQHEKNWPSQGQARFKAGTADWNQGRYLSARNNWVRADGWVARSAEAGAPARDALASLVVEADRLSRPPEEPAVEPTPAPTPEPTPVPRRARRVRELKPEPMDARAIMESARRAEEAGQTEKALRLLRIASGLPGGEEAAEKADALERALLQPAR